VTGIEREITQTELKIINLESDPASDDFGRLSGDVFVFQVNRPTNATRGRSDLLCNIDWLDAYDRFLFACLEIEELKRRMMFHLKMEGAKNQEVKAKREYMAQNPVQPGGWYISDESETIQDLVPNMRSGDMKTSSEVYRAQIYAGSGFPKHMFGVGDDVNRATAQAMTEPVIRSIMRRQKYIKFMIGQIFTFVIQQAQKRNRLPEDIDTSFTVTLPDPSPKETLILADALQATTMSLVTAMDAGLLRGDQAREIYQAELAKMGHVPEDQDEKAGEKDEEAEEGVKAYEKAKKPA
jgi:hypothetical protein